MWKVNLKATTHVTHNICSVLMFKGLGETNSLWMGGMPTLTPCSVLIEHKVQFPNCLMDTIRCKAQTGALEKLRRAERDCWTDYLTTCIWNLKTNHYVRTCSLVPRLLPVFQCCTLKNRDHKMKIIIIQLEFTLVHEEACEHITIDIFRTSRHYNDMCGGMGKGTYLATRWKL